jgi:hypothetical protein
MSHGRHPRQQSVDKCLLQLGDLTASLPTSLGPPAWGFFASVAVFYAVSYATQPVSQDRQERFHGYLTQR